MTRSSRSYSRSGAHASITDKKAVIERVGMAKVLNAAALTYVAAAVSTLMTLLYFLMRAGLLGGRRD